MANEDHAPEPLPDPPQGSDRSEGRLAALLSYGGPVVVLLAIFGVALIYWVNRGPSSDSAAFDRGVIGTSGQTAADADSSQPFDSTRGEIDARAGEGAGDTASALGGDDLVALTTIDRIVASGPRGGRAVTLAAVRVEKVADRTVWVRDGKAQIAVQLPNRAAAPARGDRVDVSGVTASRDGSIRILADAIYVK